MDDRRDLKPRVAATRDLTVTVVDAGVNAWIEGTANKSERIVVDENFIFLFGWSYEGEEEREDVNSEANCVQ